MEKYTRMSPEWAQWLDGCLAKGCVDKDIVTAMVAANYDPDYCLKVVAERREALSLNPVQGEGGELQVTQSTEPYRYGTPRFPQTGNVIRTSDRLVRVSMRVGQPVVAVLDNLLTEEECDGLIALARGQLEPSATVDPLTGQNQVKDHRTSQGTFLKSEGSGLIQRVERRIAEVMNVPVSHGEALHILHYQVGAEYRPHFDYFDPANSGFAATLKRGGQRISTLIVYLNDVEDAGDTIFPKIHLSVVPKKGAAVYFEYVNESGQLDELTLHGGAPVVAGEKWVATKWMRLGEFV
ncbi:2OG-Fe(II) oxygenase [Massilia endophytica]|uniref:2OG-Fe(II) oxygenase n=1 Tax=Massilia endophytica TaxID=2899220 RepID=UPI001E54C1AC|nr:2OG-Fe(II) oxygenase [Massilia endophytica]UGQ47994.1 2OG-Fe(II) oxygenase [Massilia endophytica]